MFSGITPYLFGTIAILGVVFGIYFFWSQSKMEKQAKEILAYEITIDSQKKALVQLGVDIETIKQINSGLSNVERENAENASKLADKLSNLGTYAKEKPDIVQRLVNESADMRIRCFALATGAKPLENEVNNVCPHLLPKVGSDD